MIFNRKYKIGLLLKQPKYIEVYNKLFNLLNNLTIETRVNYDKRYFYYNNSCLYFETSSTTLFISNNIKEIFYELDVVDDEILNFIHHQFMVKYKLKKFKNIRFVKKL